MRGLCLLSVLLLTLGACGEGGPADSHPASVTVVEAVTLPAGSTTSTTVLPPPSSAAETTTTTSAGTTTSGTLAAPTTPTTVRPFRPATTTTSTRATTIQHQSPCAGRTSVTIPVSATDLSSVAADVDGDGTHDEVIVYRHEGAWRVHMRLSDGHSVATNIDSASATEKEAITATNMGGSGELAVVAIDSGASVDVLGFFAMLDCRAVHVTFDHDGETRTTGFAVGGSVAHLDGMICHPGGVTVTSARPLDWGGEEPSPWELTVDEYEYRPELAHLRLVSSSTSRLLWPDDLEAIGRAGGFECGDVDWVR